MPVNFKVYNTNKGEPIKFGFLEFDKTNSPTGWFSSNGGAAQG